jgi:8-oxo-dGTP diphosphatase
LAVRECYEELRIRVANLRYCGQHRFQFVDGYSLLVWVYSSTEFEGVPTETAEAKPLWFPLDSIPYERMWQDDCLWLPLLLRGERFQGRWLFDGDRMLDHELVTDT